MPPVVMLPSPPAPACTTVTARPQSEILRQLRTAATPELPKLAVEIVAGENLCLSLQREPKAGKVESFGLVESGAAPQVALEVLLSALPDGSSVLSVQNN